MLFSRFFKYFVQRREQTIQQILLRILAAISARNYSALKHISSVQNIRYRLSVCFKNSREILPVPMTRTFCVKNGHIFKLLLFLLLSRYVTLHISIYGSLSTFVVFSFFDSNIGIASAIKTRKHEELHERCAQKFLDILQLHDKYAMRISISFRFH